MFPKFTHIQSHFIHLYFLTEFEIIFYIFYVMPYEKTVFKRIVKDMMKDVIDVRPSRCHAYQTELDDANAKLWNYCVIYLGTINAILLVVFIHDVWKNCRTYAKTTRGVHSPKSNLAAFGSNPNFICLTIEMTNKKSDTLDQRVCSPIEVETQDDISLSFHVYYWRNSKFVTEFIKTIEFIVLVALFEYFFFVSIVDKFKIANSRTLLCDE